MRAIHKAAFSRLTIIGVLLAVGVLLLVAMAPANAANAPTAFTATAGDSQVTLGWNIPNDSTISGYQVLAVAIDKLVGPSTGTGAIGAGDRFGDSVGIGGNRAVVGAPFQTSKDNSNNDIAGGGWGHAFSRGSGGWNYDEFLALSNPQEGGRLGSSVAVAGSTAIIGAPSTSQSNNADAGRITIASKSSVTGSWGTEFTKIGEAGNDLFGSSVALDTGIAVVGAPGATASGHAFAGKAYLYTKASSGTWGLTEVWFAGNSNVGVGHIFGISVAVDGNTVVVGSPGEDTFSGAVYVFTKGNSGWDFDARLTAPGAANNDSFGRSVAVDGNSVVVGAWQDDDGGADSGSTFVFTKPNAGWSAWGGLSETAKGNLTAKLTASDAAADDHFGWSVAVDGDNVVVGAYGNDDDGTDSGSVYLFAKPSGAWATATETVKLTAPDGAGGDHFGESVAAGGGRAIVGAPGDESATGAAYVFSIPGWTDISGSGAGTTSHTVTGLTNGVEYTFLIRPVVGSGYGPASESEQATPMPSPAAPTNLAAVLGDGEVVLTWANPTDSAITKYQYSTNGGTSFTDIGGSGAATTAYVVTGLTNGAQYTLAVRAVNVYGAGMASTVTATPTAPPAVPVYLSNMGQTTAVNDLADLSSAQAQSFSTGANALGYLFGSIDVYVERAPGSGTLTVSVRDTNASGQPGSTVHTLTNPATVGTGIQRFTAPADAQLVANTNYFLHLTFSGSGTTPRLLTTESDTLDSGTATGWSMDDFRYYSSGANWFAHTDALKISINNVPPPVPAAPTNLVATPGDRQVVLTWTNPNNDTITKYQYSTNGGTSFSDFDGGSNKDSTSYTVTGLDNGVTHTLAVRAVNSSGDGTAATVDAVMIPAAPANLMAMPRDGMVALSWDDAGSATITEYQLMQLAEESELIASDAAKNDRFGVSVAVDDDTAVVGAFHPDYVDSGTNVSRPGAAYVYTKDSNGAWSQQAKLTASDGADGDEFGISVAVDGDTVVVGARGNVSKTGAIYVFTKPSDGDWTSTITETKLTATGGAADDLFGASVALYGDTIVVGAPGDQITVAGGVVRSGSVYVFTKNSGVWGEAANLTATNAAEGDLFGNSVAVDDDTIAVGAYQKDDNSITNSGLAYMFVKPGVAAWATTTETVQLRASDQAANDNFGRSVAIDTGTIVVGASGDRIGGTDVSTGSAYVFTEPNTGWANSGGAETAKLTASDGAHTDQFGRSVAVDGDTIVVGAHQNDDDGSDSGSIYVFIKPTNGWEGTSGTVKLTASNAATGDRFGIALALDGDTALVAAPRNDANDDDDNDDNDVSDAGSAYVIGTSGWAKIPDDAAAIRSQTLTGLTNNIKHTFAVRAVNASGNGPASTASAMPAPVPDAPTGLSATPGDGQVALSWTDPDNDTITKYQYNADGGANFPDFDGGSSASTTSYTVTGLDNGVTYTVALRAVNISGAGAASTVTAVMVPAAPKLSAAPGDGQVVLSWDDPGNPTIGEYQLSQSDPPEWSRITGTNATTHTVTGLTNYTRYSFQIRAVNKTGAGPASNSASATPRLPKPAKPASLTAVAGDKKVTLRWTDPDDSTIDKYQISEVIPEDFLTASGGLAGDHFGVSVAIDGDTAVVGADRANTRNGSVYIFTRESNGNWTQQAELEGGNTGDQFGWSVAVDGDTVVVGAHAYDGKNDDDETLVNSGAVYVITKPDTDANSDGSSDWNDWDSLSDDDRARLTDTLTATTPEAYAFFGGSVDLDGNTLAIGSRLADVGGYLSAGAAYVFTKTNDEWSQAAKLTASIPLQLAYLGYSLAVDGDTVLVGAYGDDTVFGELGSGSAYVFDKPPGGWTDGNETAKLTASDRQPSGYFGFSVALDGDTAVIGARQHNDPASGAGSGAAYVFTRESSVWGEKAKLTPSDAAAGDNFGVSVAVEDGTVVVGSWQDDDNGRNSGSAYVFTKPDLGWANTFETMKFTDPDGADNDRFGWSVGVDLDAVRGDLALVGVYSDDNANGTDAGSVHVLGIPNWVNIGDENDDGIDYNDDGTITHNVIKVPDGTNTDLRNGTEYTFQIRAVNDGGAGPASEGASATPVGPPAELMGLAADPGDSQVRLHWAAPTPSRAVAPITGYQYQLQEQDAEGNFGAWSNVWTEIQGGGTVTEHTKARLANTAHRFRVRAVNKIGDGPSSEVDATPVSVTPLAPRLSATPGDTQVRLQWPDPGDFSIDKYQYRWIEQGGTLGAWDDVPKGADGTIIRAVTVTGLINNTTYTFEVRAVDERDGGDEASDPPATVDATPTAMGMQPAAPNLMSHPGNKRVGLAWDDPDDASIDKYQYRWIEMGSTLGDWNDVPTGADGTIIHAVTVTGLINGTTYSFEVHAVDVHDGGDEAGAVARVDATPMPDRPDQPTGLGARAGNREVALRWDDPNDETISKYEVVHLLRTSELHASSGSTNDKFGYAVAVDGDTAVVGAYRDDSYGADSGAAYVFTRNPLTGLWGGGVKLTASGGAAYDNFGISVAVDGTTNTVVVGASGDDADATDSGSAYVFVKPAGGGWVATSTPTARLTPSDGASLDYFGHSVAVSADTVLVGAYQHDDEDADLEDSGLVYVFVKPSGAAWSTTSTETTKLIAAAPADDDWFGVSVALDGNRALIGMPGDDDKGVDSGSVYVFTRDSQTRNWDAGKKLTASDAAPGDWFGYAVAVDGDTVVVGAYRDDSTDNDGNVVTDSGSAYVFVEPSGGWALWDDSTDKERARLTASDGEAFDYFGYAVAVDGDTVLVGAYQHDSIDPQSGSVISNSGSAYVFTEDSESGDWSQTNKLTADGGSKNDWFGYTVAVDRASHTALVGAGSAHVLDIHDWAEVEGSGSGTTSATVDDLINGRVYDFEVRAVNLAGEGPESDQLSATPRAPLGPPPSVGQKTNRAPFFSDGDSVTFAVAENTPAGGIVGNVAATDPDDDTLTFSLSGDDASYFDLDVSTGQIKVGLETEVDYESDATSYSVIVSVHDGKNAGGNTDPTIDDSITVAIDVTDVEEPPSQPGAPEVSSVGPTALTASWTAPENQGPEISDYDVRYREAGAGFQDAGYNGIGTSVTLDGLTPGTSYELQVRAINAEGASPWSESGRGETEEPTPTSVGQKTNRAPFFSDGDSVTFAVAENTPAGGIVGNVAATDPDDDTLTFSLSGDDASYFDLDVSTGQIKVGLETEVDYESDATSYSVIVSVHDGKNAGGNTDPTIDDSITVAIDVTDVEEPPSQPGAPEVSSVGPTALTASWTAPENQGPEISDYDVRYREAGAGFQDAGYNGIGTSVTLDGLTPGTSYELQVRAINAEGASPWSESGRGETEEPTPTPTPTATVEPTPEPTPETPAVPDTGNGGFAAAGNSGSPVLALLLGMLAIAGLAGARASSRRVSGRTRTSSR